MGRRDKPRHQPGALPPAETPPPLYHVTAACDAQTERLHRLLGQYPDTAPQVAEGALDAVDTVRQAAGGTAHRQGPLLNDPRRASLGDQVHELIYSLGVGAGEAATATAEVLRLVQADRQGDDTHEHDD